MFIRRGVLPGVNVRAPSHARIALLTLACTCIVGTAVADRADRGPTADHTRTYQFKARIKADGGIAPFKVGETITGVFTYDRKGKNKFGGDLGLRHGAYHSARNALSFQTGDSRFSGAGEVLVTVGAFDHAEHFQIVAPDLELPKGWEMDHTGRSQTYSFLLQNVPPKGVITHPGIPNRLSLSDFVSTRELRLDFYHGVRFPGGQVNSRATVFAAVEGLEEVHR